MIATRKGLPPESLPYVSVDEFEGPFDVLLELAQAHKVDISRVSLQEITDDFLAYVAEHSIPTEHQLDFLLVTSTLLLLKVQRALPQLSEEEEEEVTELTDRLRLYQLYREQAKHIRKRWQQHTLHGKAPQPIETAYADISYSGAQLGELLRAVYLRQEQQKPPTHHLRRQQGKSLAECLDSLHDRLQEVPDFVFDDFVTGGDKQTRAVSFLALLELARRGDARATQENLFGPITVQRV